MVFPQTNMFSQISSSSSSENHFSRERSLSQKHSIPLPLESFARNCLALCVCSFYPPPRYSAQQAAASGASPRRKNLSRVKLSCSVCECDPKGRSSRPDLVLGFLNWKKRKENLVFPSNSFREKNIKASYFLWEV